MTAVQSLDSNPESALVAIVIPVVVVTAAVAVVLVVFTEIAVPVAVPAVVMLPAAAISFPVTDKELFPIVARGDPTRLRIWWPGPITFMPPVAPAHRIPVTIYPHE